MIFFDISVILNTTNLMDNFLFSKKIYKFYRNYRLIVYLQEFFNKIYPERPRERPDDVLATYID